MTRSKFDKNNFIASMIKRQSRDRLEEFRQYTLEIESKFNSDKTTLASSYQNAIDGLSEPEISEIADFFSEDYYMVEEIHIGMYRKSTLVSIYSFLENSMNNLCRHLYLRHGYPVKLSDLTNAGIVRAKTYLQKLPQVDFSTLNSEWGQLKNLSKIRNCIVHSEGDVKAFNGTVALESIISKNSGLSLKNERSIRVEREYIDTTINTVEEFLDKLHQQVFGR